MPSAVQVAFPLLPWKRNHVQVLNFLHIFFCITDCTVFTLLTSFCAGSFLYLPHNPLTMYVRLQEVYFHQLDKNNDHHIHHRHLLLASHLLYKLPFSFYSITLTMNRNVRIIFIVTNKIIPSFTRSLIAARF